MKRSEIIILVLILLAGAALRILYLSEIRGGPEFDHPGIDAHYHDYWARGLVTGDWSAHEPYTDPMIESKPFFRAPGYPYFLALIYRLSGGSYLVIRIVQMLLGLLSVLIAFALGRRWFGSTVALIFAGLMSVYWVFIYYEGDLLEPSLLNPLGLLLIYTLGLWSEKVTWKRAIVAGVLLGLFALVRQNIIPFGLVALGWIYWILRERRDPRRFRIAAIGLIIGASATILPATVRNLAVGGDMVLISSSGGVNLYIGNNDMADGYTSVAPGFPRWTSHDYPRIVEALGNSVGRELSYSQASALFTQAARSWIKQNPGKALRLTLRKAFLFWGPMEVSNEKEDEFEHRHYLALHILPLNFAVALSLALMGTLVCFAQAGRPKNTKEEEDAADAEHRVFVLVLLFILTFFLTYLPFFVAGRFRVPIIPGLLLLGACGIARLGRMVACGDFKGVIYWGFFWIIAYALAGTNFTHYQPSADRWHFARGTAYSTVGQYDLAEAEYEKALEANPDSAETHAGLALVLRTHGKLDDAVREFREAVRLSPSLAQAHANLAVTLYMKGDYLGAWKEVALSRQYGIEPGADFVEQLSEKMPEPRD